MMVTAKQLLLVSFLFTLPTKLNSRHLKVKTQLYILYVYIYSG